MTNRKNLVGFYKCGEAGNDWALSGQTPGYKRKPALLLFFLFACSPDMQRLVVNCRWWWSLTDLCPRCWGPWCNFPGRKHNAHETTCVYSYRRRMKDKTREERKIKSISDKVEVINNSEKPQHWHLHSDTLFIQACIGSGVCCVTMKRLKHNTLYLTSCFLGSKMLSSLSAYTFLEAVKRMIWKKGGRQRWFFLIIWLYCSHLPARC